MIEKIKIKDVATYDTEGIEINLKKINYIFGSNGTGKTTISEFLRNRNNPRFSSSSIEWKQNKSNFEIFVYNKHFVRENFGIRNEIKGIFTLGKESSDIIKLIDKKMEEIRKHQEEIEDLDNNINEKKEQLKLLRDDFVEKCWKLKIKYDDVFKEAFKGLRNNRERFMEKCLEEAKSNNNELHTYEELKKRVESVFNGPQEKIDLITNIQFDESVEENSIFQTKIIGKEDIDIARLITTLNISDWVQQGRKYMEHTNGLCPFCQQELPKNFKAKLDEYFDETFNKQINILNLAIKRYQNEIDGIIKNLQFLKNQDIPFINRESVSHIIDVINSTYKENILLLEKKKNEPSRSIELRPIAGYIKQIKFEIEKANLQITNINRVIDNIKDEKVKLIKDIWRFIVEENKDNYKHYIYNFTRDSKALEGMKTKKENKLKYKKKLEQEVTQLQNQLTSVLPSINEINNLLKSFGFTNFKLAESEEKGNYKIIRENGEDANETLSEGEKTFITFLYFYQLLKGSNNKDMVNTDRIIVIDDPISSLDSNILFIVSTLINNLKKKIRSNKSNFKQLIILTHNVYFHKEISFNELFAM
jgi:wobble nucleotide-excising tRNase